MPERHITKRDITRDQFHALIKKAAQPIEPSESDLEQSGTLEQNQDDGCSGIDIHSDMTEDTSD